MSGKNRRWCLWSWYGDGDGELVGRRITSQRAAVDLTTNEGDGIRRGCTEEIPMEMDHSKGSPDL